MTVGQKPVTAEELLEIPNDGLRRELVRGEVRTMAPAGNVHGRIAMNISTPLHPHVRTNGLGVVFAAETGFKISDNPDTVRAPDTAFVRQERGEAVGDAEGYWPEAPDLAVEMVSPNDRFFEGEEKVAGWLAAGARMVIVANPHGKTVTVRRSEREAVIPPKGRRSRAATSSRAGPSPSPTSFADACGLTWKPWPTFFTRTGGFESTKRRGLGFHALLGSDETPLEVTRM